MSSGSILKNVLLAALQLLCALLLVFDPDGGVELVAGILELWLTLFGVRRLVYYATMARHMVGGKVQLFYGVLAIDLAGFMYVLVNRVPFVLVFYLVGVHGFAGVVDLMGCLDARKHGAPWHGRALQAGVNLLVTLACVALCWIPGVLVYVFAGGLAVSAFVRLANSFKRTDIVYVA